MEQVRLDPSSILGAKRETRPAAGAGDLFAILLDSRLKNAGGRTLAGDPGPGATPTGAAAKKARRMSGPSLQMHRMLPADPKAGDRETFRLKEKADESVRAARLHRETPLHHDAAKSLTSSGAGISENDGVTAPVISTPAGRAENSCKKAEDAHDPSAGIDVEDEPGSSGPADPSTGGTGATAHGATIPIEAQQPEGKRQPSSVPNAASDDEAKAMAEAALAAAASALPLDSFVTSTGPAESEQPAGVPALEATPSIPATGAITEPEAKGIVELAVIRPDQAFATGKGGAGAGDSAGAATRPTTATGKGRTPITGQGGGATHQQPHEASPPIHQTASQGSTGGTPGQGGQEDGVPAIDGEFEPTDPGSRGWPLHLAQGASARRAEFIANLRQHLQSLPAHEQVAIHIQRAVSDRLGKLTVDLSPVELGRIQVKLRIDEDNHVAATVSVERPGTLELLQRDSRALERALQEAGLKTDSGSLSFSLQRGETGEFGQEHGRSPWGDRPEAGESGEAAAIVAPARPAVVETADGLVDVEV